MTVESYMILFETCMCTAAPYLPYPPLPKEISECFPEGRGGCAQDIMYHQQHNVNFIGLPLGGSAKLIINVNYY